MKGNVKLAAAVLKAHGKDAISGRRREVDCRDGKIIMRDNVMRL